MKPGLYLDERRPAGELTTYLVSLGRHGYEMVGTDEAGACWRLQSSPGHGTLLSAITQQQFNEARKAVA
ncbi:MAG TPA: hypothetical protein VGS58_22525 [Candidatus Sulfopaludibacter sp.]|nr:hypothetical protein [Candidatus Sulfopaludibacter sp.]